MKTRALVSVPPPFPKGRRCRQCGTVLSGYNPCPDRCALHGGWQLPGVPQRKPTADEHLEELMGAAA